ncbi:hypothetical protein JAAARDRAFT_204605 [Jaapia argillacea MUCL 33604]|uniref:Kinesin motor domain-containing protein n=1 Tax=Jaapia argillacea MUCL 33604 TaxID=933084 RepID=A0A067Q3S6_9AGAM|nr:hypothetical protein JAAARDRAFT_204605 [Jaapia argillacea MUCL 33604]
MASRRAPTRTRSNTNSNTMLPPSNISRPRSALTNSKSSQRSGQGAHPGSDDTLVDRSTHAPSLPPSPKRVPLPSIPGSSSKPSHNPHTTHHPSEDSETNIQVVIRCRRRSDREIQENSPIITSSNGAKSTDITIETAIPVSSLGMVTLPPTRTYPFDLVFGPEADQAMIYHDVVSPMLEEVLMGYNCTLFAYGQTGTGKTYTMQGDLAPTPMGNPSAQAGMIPRVLFRLFHQLESSKSDYSVKISFIELYNEELRDLLAPELAAPVGSAQPMGKGSGTVTDASGLKIFEDASKKGVFIQGLEEPCVKDAADALTLLSKGSHRRQVAATKFNDHSSRSHSVFSITVHTKETSAMGDDLLKVGKLNLVDLAGSENIGRSGAENKRAREAGMINQSLLTLGRVINALVDKSSHIPYRRESKLTRLLQDSLGGRTKTCIIATISPARSNMEETLSTLDYAIRAKSIRNKPELNARMTRNSLLKEYVAEIERLKSDVLAAREKNGIFFSEERWNEMTAENEMRLTEMEERKKQVEIVESQLRNVREEFEQSVGLLMKREGELKEARETLREKEGELVRTEGQLKVVKGALEEEVVVRQAYQGSEVILDGVASGLKQVAGESTGDLVKLFDKLDRKSSLFSSNAKAVLAHGRTLSVEIQCMSSNLEDFSKHTSDHASQLKTEAEQFQVKEIQALTAQSSRIDEHVNGVQTRLQAIQAKEEVSSEAVELLQSTVKQLHDGIKNGFKAWSEGLRKTCDDMCSNLQVSSSSSNKTVESTLASMTAIVETVVREAYSHVEAERKSLQEAKNLAESTVNAEVLRLREQNASLSRMLESEKVKSQRAKDDLIERVSGLLSSFTSERDRSLRETISQVQLENAGSEAEIMRFGEAHGQKIDEASERGKEWRVSVERRSVEGKRTRDGALKALSTAGSTIKDGLSDLQTSVSASTSSYSTDLQRHAQTFNSDSAGVFDQLTRAKRARMEATNSMASEVQSGYRSLQRGIASTTRNVDAMAGRVVSETTSISNRVGAYNISTSRHLVSAQQATRSLIEQGAREDAPTGTTPRKRVWNYVDQWEVTKNREEILKEWRQRGMSAATSETFLAEHLPLPEGTEEDDETTQTPNEPVRDVDEIMAAPIQSPTPSSSASSTTLAPPPTLPPVAVTKKHIGGMGKSALPPMGTLTERPTNVPTIRRRLR